MENNRLNPMILKGNQANERLKELMGIKPINENISKITIELTKIGPDGNIYAIVKENQNHFIKICENKKVVLAEDFKYIGGLQNKNLECHTSYAKAIKRLNAKFNMLAEKFNYSDNINIFVDDNLLTELSMSETCDTSDLMDDESEIMDEEKPEIIENDNNDELSEVEKAIDGMVDCEKDNTIMENTNSIFNEMLNIDQVINSLFKKNVKKKV